ncbi:MAG: sodium:solute symporter [Oscillospiraceae bacterium]
MENVDAQQLFGIVLTIAVFALIGVLSGKKVKTKSDYYVAGQRFGAISVAGTTAGMFVGGGSVIGTAQLAFTDGFSGLYFSIGCCLALVLMGLGFAKPIRKTDCQTIQEMIAREYGSLACLLATFLGILGFYINNIAHFLSGISLIGSLFPFSTLVSSLITGGLILVSVFMGGFLGMSFINVLKTFILMATVLTASILIGITTDNFSTMAAALPERYFSLFPRSMNSDIGNFLSTTLGIMSTQTTIQAIFAARSDKDSRIGFVLGAFLLPVVGICCVIIGMYMKMVAPDISSLEAFPRFVIMHTQGFVCGVILATTLIAVTSAGVSVLLGIAGILLNNIYLRFRPDASSKKQLLFSRLVIIALLTITTLIINTGASDGIMQYNFLSMGMRSAVLFLPMCAALFMPGKISPRFAIASIVLGPVAIMLAKFVLPLPFDFIFFGMTVCAIIMVLGYWDKKLSRRRV